jgi:hypothetical protein
MKKYWIAWLALLFPLLIVATPKEEGTISVHKGKVIVLTPVGAPARVLYGAERLEKALSQAGYQVGMDSTSVRDVQKKLLRKSSVVRILVGQSGDEVMTLASIGLEMKFDRSFRKEGFNICSAGNTYLLRGHDASGSLYACLELADSLKANHRLPAPAFIDDQPEMVLRGACIGMQKPYYLPGRTVYEYPYTPENFPWFYDKAMWIKYLDMLVENRMNSLYLWNGHPFASLVKLPDYPFAVEVSDEDFRKNEEIFAFLTKEADKRGVWVIQMFYNILVSKPFAEHYGIKTQDGHAPINPIVADYTRKSIAAFIEKYPNVGLLVCLGEAIATYEDDVEWFTKTIIPGVQDGLKQLGRTEEVPILLRAHDTNCEMVMKAALPLYRNLYTMNKYNGESLCTYQPGGPWAETHKALSQLGSTHVDNVHILANLEPFRWSSPDFIQKAVGAMHSVHGANGLHLYPQASYWDWPYTADNVPGRLLQVDRDRLWYDAWARYAWKQGRDRKSEIVYWSKQLEERFGCPGQGCNILKAYEETGEISPKLTRKLAITEGNRQTFLLGSFMSQLVNPSRWKVWPGFHASCGPEGEMLADWVQKEMSGEKHIGENPVDLARQALMHAKAAVQAIDSVNNVTREAEEFARLKNDVYAYAAFARFMYAKVLAAASVLRYSQSGNLNDLDKARPFLLISLNEYRKLVKLTSDAYLYANSMQTKQRRIPIGGDDGKNKTWSELLPFFEDELIHFDNNLGKLKLMAAGTYVMPKVEPLKPVEVQVLTPGLDLVGPEQAPQAFTDRESTILNIADELKGLKGLRYSFDNQRNKPTELKFSCNKPISVLVGYFSSVHTDYLFAPKLETDASANDFGQAEICLANALEIKGQPPVNIHTYTFPAGENTLKLSKGVVMILGFIDGTQPIRARDAGLGEKTSIDWLFY